MPPPNEAENRDSVDQKLQQVRALIESQPKIFSRQGAVVRSWRTYHGQRLGPYFRLTYRDQQRQRSVYLGRSPELASRVKQLLDQARKRRKQQLELQRIRKQARAALRRHQQQWTRDLRRAGLSAHGFDIRGCRGRRTTTTPAFAADEVPVDDSPTTRSSFDARLLRVSS